MTRARVITLIAFCLLAKNVWSQAIVGDVIRLKPRAVPTTCNAGDLRIDSNDSNSLKVCVSNNWTAFLTATSISSTANLTVNNITAASVNISGNSNFGANVTAGGSFIGNLTGLASTAGTASYAATSGTASFATTSTTSTTASSAGFAAISAITTAFATNPADCSANQFATTISTLGDLTCAQPNFSDLAGTASIAQGGTNNGTLAVTAGGILYTDGTRIMNAGAGTAGQVLTSNGASAPTWSTQPDYAWTGMHVGDCLFTVTNTAPATFAADASCTFSERYNLNMGTVIAQPSGGDKLPGVVFTAAATGAWKVCANIAYYGPATALVNIGFVMLNTSGSTMSVVSEQTPVNAQNVMRSFICGHFSVLTASTVQTISLTGFSGSGTISVVAPTSSHGQGTIEWYITKE